MKKILTLIIIFFITQIAVYSEETDYTTDNLTAYSLNNLYGLKDKSDKVVVQGLAKDSKIILHDKKARKLQLTD